VVGALAANFQHFMKYIQFVVVVVFIHNGLALVTGFSLSTLLGLNERDRRAVTFEMGIQNSGLGLILIFNLFDGLGGMAIITAWWGIWHIVSGLTLALFWSKRDPRKYPASPTNTTESEFQHDPEESPRHRQFRLPRQPGGRRPGPMRPTSSSSRSTCASPPPACRCHL
jgi:hypothetical protein